MLQKSLVTAALVLVLMAGSATAGIITTVTPQSPPSANLQAFLVTLTGGPGVSVGGVSLLSVTGAYQVWQNTTVGAKGGQTPVGGDVSSGAFGIAGSDIYDSHLLVNPSGNTVNLSPGFGVAETNSGANEAGLPATAYTPGSPFSGFPGSAGVGNLNFTGAQATMAFLSPQPKSVDLLYLTYLRGQQPKIHLVADALDSTGATTHIDIFIPEPATMVLAGLGAIGLVGLVRRRK